MNLRWARDAIYCLLVLRFVDVNLVLSLCLSLSLSQGTSLLQLMKRLAPRNDFLLLLRCLQPGKMAEFFLYQWCWLQACPREPWHAILDFLFLFRAGHSKGRAVLKRMFLFLFADLSCEAMFFFFLSYFSFWSFPVCVQLSVSLWWRFDVIT